MSWSSSWLTGSQGKIPAISSASSTPLGNPVVKRSDKMPPSSFPVVLLHGSPFERGRVHGLYFAGQIRTAIRQMKRRHGTGAFRDAERRAAQSWEFLATLAPAVLLELKGLAEGCGCSLHDLYLHSSFEFFLGQPATGCSAIALRGAKGAIVGQNWDAPPSTASDLAVFVHTGPAGFERAVVASVGMLGWVGCNQAGVALVNNDLMLDAAPTGLPSQVVRRLVLDQSNVKAALDTLTSVPHMSGRSYLLGDADGNVAAVEVSPSTGARQLEGQVLVHTNHALATDVKAVEDGETLRSTYPSSFRRLDALRRAISDTTNVAGAARVLSDTEGMPEAVSKDVSVREKTQTVFSVIFDCGARELHLCAGRPDIGSYSTYQLAPLASHQSHRHDRTNLRAALLESGLRGHRSRVPDVKVGRR
ncbi:MAG: hypothetical protein E5W82_25230 [Mesorhizobium sp.]|nr:MAG: hypothetical protein E5W82_25230 [Mesorhizobium sp.]